VSEALKANHRVEKLYLDVAACRPDYIGSSNSLQQLLTVTYDRCFSVPTAVVVVAAQATEAEVHGEEEDTDELRQMYLSEMNKIFQAACRTTHPLHR
jgi:hypothetical protein